ncbi:MAG: HlyD family efflux transporter periplasmic adaptor subunit [Planctomycetales bacterium]|nr:HlyD family efflux transporter periplasmic adaptor subunit [Planctomycetales bacterium]
MFTASTDNLDQLLDQFEALARSDMPTAQFLAALIERLRLTMAAQSARVMLFADSDQCLPLASGGQSPHAVQIEREIADQLRSVGARERLSLTGVWGEVTWIAVPLRPGDFSKGYLLVTIESIVPEHTLDGLIELQAAFAEVILIRQQEELEAFLGRSWDQVPDLCLQIALAPSQDNSATLLVGGLARILDAARVSLLSSRTLSSPSVQAVSGVPKVSPSANVVQALQAIGSKLQRSGKPLLRQQPSGRVPADQTQPELSDDGCFSNLLGLRLAADATTGAVTNLSRPARAVLLPPTWLVIEYESHAKLMHSAALLPHVLPTLAVAWEQQSRWLRVPKLARLFALGPASALRASLRLLKWPMLIGLLGLAIWAARQPYPLVIEAEGAYEPATSRAIYAADDGFVEELLVEDGESVQASQPLVQLRSPTLELRIEQVTGELRGVAEESSGIHIAINQLDPDSPDLLNNQSRLAGKIAELKTKQTSLEKQLELLQTQRASLLLRAPIGGTIVAKDLQRHLAGRPVRRGEPLFSIVDQAGPWQVRVQVGDRDAGYLRTHYVAPTPTFSKRAIERRHNAGSQLVGVTLPDNEPSGNRSIVSDLDSAITFGLDSSPAERWPAQLSWISDHVENIHGQGCFVEVRAAVESPEQIGAHAGAGVHAYFTCGSQPLWFVWSRPLVEAIERKFWFRSQTDE